jgi:peptidyl-prolyl cis-trans isomerase C
MVLILENMYSQNVQRSILRFILLSLLGLPLLSCSRKDPVVAQVGDRKIYSLELQTLFKSLPPPVQERSMSEAGRLNLVNSLINKEILATEAQKRGFSNSSKDVTIDQLNTAVLSEMIPTESELLEYYREHPLKFSGTQMNVSHIFLKTEREAKKVSGLLRQGMPFEKAALRFSANKEEAKRGGKMRMLEKGRIDPEFERVLGNLKKNQVSTVFKTKHGYHIVRNDGLVTTPLPFGSVKEQIKIHLQNERYLPWFEQLKKTTSVQINIEVLNSIPLHP